MKIIILSSLILFLLAGPAVGGAEEKAFLIQSRLFMGSRGVDFPVPGVIISSSSQSLEPVLSENLLEAERRDIILIQRELNGIYQLENGQHLGTSNLLWDGKTKSLSSTIFLNDQAIPINLSPTLVSGKNINLRIEIFEFKGDAGRKQKMNPTPTPLQDKAYAGSEAKLLDTEIIIQTEEPYILGFPSNGKTYFLSVLISEERSGALLGRKFRGNIREISILKPPEPVHLVIPEYPDECIEKMIEGKVILEVSTDIFGRVVEARIVQSAHPLLDLSAKKAILESKYKPVKKGRRAVPVVFNVIIDFQWPHEKKAP
ncbi:MAG: energy transducer TonB [Acidobacteriota bacterium]